MDKTMAVFALLFIVFMAMMWEEKAVFGESIEAQPVNRGVDVGGIKVECYPTKLVLRNIDISGTAPNAYLFNGNDEVPVSARAIPNALELTYVGAALGEKASGFDVIVFHGEDKASLQGLECWN